MSAARQVGGRRAARALLRHPDPCQPAEMEWDTEPDRTRAVRIGVYLGRVRDVRRSFRVPADADLAAAMKRAALAAVPT